MFFLIIFIYTDTQQNIFLHNPVLIMRCHFYAVNQFDLASSRDVIFKTSHRGNQIWGSAQQTSTKMAEASVSSAQDTMESPLKSKTERDDCDEPLKKKLKKSPEKKMEEDDLEQRLSGILCCAVCLDLPECTVFQVFFSSPPSIM